VEKGIDEDRNWCDLGDDVLVAVSAMLIYGPSRPTLFSLPSPGGYDVQMIADTVIIISCSPHTGTPRGYGVHIEFPR
jgi:hypothetical protein